MRLRRQNTGFTLVEMLVVAALIAIFAGIAVFNITAQLEINKQKASVAEARQIATAMAFAQQDLGFYPKICYLRFNLPNLLQDQLNPPKSNDALESYGSSVGGIQTKLEKNWKQNYLSGKDPRGVVRMHFTPLAGGEQNHEWPADPWGNPYVIYLLHTEVPLNRQQQGTRPRTFFIRQSGERANHLAAVVSYGRNGVPGLTDTPANNTDYQVALGARLYTPVGNNIDFTLVTHPNLNTPAKMNPMVYDGLNGGATAKPTNFVGIRDKGADDRYFEF